MKAIRQIQTDLITIQRCYAHTGRHLVMMPHIERSNFNGTGQIIRQTETMKFPLRWRH
jgi:hypothetical protein